MEKLGKQTIKFTKPPTILDTACIVGPKEAEGPLAKYFDKCLEDEFWGEKTWEKAESKILKETVYSAVKKSNLPISSIDYCFAGDLLNQCISSSFGLRDSNIPFIGIFGACSTFVEGFGLGSIFIDGGAANNVICAASSHFCSAEKQFRFPLEYGNQRPFSATWTVTGCGAAIVTKRKGFARITGVTTGKIIDYGVKDAQNMGACMAPAATDTIYRNFQDLGRTQEDYDQIITGDLGYIGQSILFDLMKSRGYDIRKKHMDCGMTIFDQETQDTHAGGSGCGCAASTLASYILPKLESGEWRKILFVPTGALMSTVSFNEGASVPGIAHAIMIEHC